MCLSYLRRWLLRPERCLSRPSLLPAGWRASCGRVLKCLPQPTRKTEKRFNVACSTTYVLRLWWPVHHCRSDVFMPVSKPDGSCSPLQSRRRVEHPHHVLWLPKFLVRHPAGVFEHLFSAYPILTRNVAHDAQQQICALTHPTGGRRGAACQ